MQLSMLLLALPIGLVFTNLWFILYAVVMFSYGQGIAHWSECNDLGKRFGQDYTHYRHHVRNWIPRLSPYAPNIATLYVARGCGTCSEFGHLLQRLHPRNLNFIPAEKHPTRILTRITYESGSYRAEGILAIARVLEHTNLIWAIFGSFIRLPLICPILQHIADIVVPLYSIPETDRKVTVNK